MIAFARPMTIGFHALVRGGLIPLAMALVSMATRLPNLQLVAELAWRPTFNLRGLESLVVTA